MLVLHLASTNLVSAKSVCKCGNGEVDSPSKTVSIVIGLFSFSLATLPFAQSRDSSCHTVRTILFNSWRSLHDAYRVKTRQFSFWRSSLSSYKVQSISAHSVHSASDTTTAIVAWRVTYRLHRSEIFVPCVCGKSTLGLFHVYTSTT